MYIEDIIDRLVGWGNLGFGGSVDFIPSYDHNLLCSFDNQISNGLGFTEKQSLIAVRILSRHKEKISLYLKQDISPFLENPQYKFTRRIISTEKSIKTDTCNHRNTKIIKVKFPFDEKLVESIKRYKEEYRKGRIKHSGYNNYPVLDWNNETKTWDFEFYEENLAWLWNKFAPLGFEFSEDLISLQNDIETIQNHLENYVPMVVFDKNRFKFVNTHSSIPQPESTDVLAVLFQAKKYGIFTWDEHINQAVADASIHPVTKLILSNSKGEGIEISGNEYSVTCLTDMMNYSKKIVVVIPGGTELENLKTFYNFFKDSGITNQQMSVLFRLDSGAGKICNDFIRENKINNPITDDVKIFFISAKVPKTILQSNFEIDTILNLGTNSAHYTLKNLIKNHHCVINYTPDRSKKGLNFANL